MITIISILLVYITIINAIVFLSYFFRNKEEINNVNNSLENASVIVAFKNEIQNLPSLITSLQNQLLDVNKFEVILVNDYSDDNSLELAKSLISNTQNFKVINNKYKQGKKNALKTGIEESKNEILVFTDADCIPNKEWLQTIIKHFDDDTQIVYGFSPFLTGKSFINKICRYENLFTSILMKSFHNLEFPYMSFGRNFSYRKSLFYKLGEFKEIEHSISGDDDLFFQLAIKYKAKAKLMTEPESIVFSKCNLSFKEFFNQKSRHISASRYYLPEIKASLGLIYGSNILLNIFIIPSFFSLDLFLITFVLLNVLIKTFLVIVFIRKIKVQYPLLIIPFIDFIYNLLLVTIGIRSRLKIVQWK